jgi:hypothetical protein
MGSNTLIYAFSRMMSLAMGWLIAYGIAWVADWIISGAKWPVFIALAGWWTYISVVYVSREAKRARQRTESGV